MRFVLPPGTGCAGATGPGRLKRGNCKKLHGVPIYLRGLFPALFLWWLTPLSQSGATAQETVVFDGMRECESCFVALQPLVHIGDESGPGSIETQNALLRYGGDPSTYAVFRVGGDHVSIFDADGSFQGRIGQRGSGPGEFQYLLDVHVLDSILVALDAGNGKVVGMRSDGGVSFESSIRVSPGAFRIATDSTILIAAMGLRPELVGYPFHEVVLRTGEAIAHFGEDGPFNLGAESAGQVRLGWSPSRDRTWLMRGTRTFEEWSVPDRHLIRRISIDPDWIPSPHSGSRDSLPPGLQVAFGVDRRDRMWLINLVLREPRSWEDIPASPSGERRIRTSDLGEYYDVRLDVIDLAEAEHIGHFLWPGPTTVDLVQLGEDLAIRTVELDERLVPRVTVFRVVVG